MLEIVNGQMNINPSLPLCDIYLLDIVNPSFYMNMIDCSKKKNYFPKINKENSPWFVDKTQVDL